DRTATIALIKIIRAAAPRHIKLIYFNDPALIRAGYTRYYAGHDDHMHVRFCEATHPDSRYVCAPAPNPSPTPTPTVEPTPSPTETPTSSPDSSLDPSPEPSA
ncbi:MAG TPA: hypothetical protein VEO91_08140, partial [Candidatus Limnocylindria bacterium]|nr:hypothetical protein [Candidatus Limnocylindria bacterium]